jgi:hypothetical protein
VHLDAALHQKRRLIIGSDETKPAFFRRSGYRLIIYDFRRIS